MAQNASHLDSSGNLLVGKTSADNYSQQVVKNTCAMRKEMIIINSLRALFGSGAEPALIKIVSTDDGSLRVTLQKDGTTVGSIGTRRF